MSGKRKRPRRTGSFSTVSSTTMQDHQEPSNEHQSVDVVDRISIFPDHILHCILSHICNAKDLVRISILSKRWREVWYSFSTLIFDERNFAADENVRNKRDVFIKYVDDSLQNHRVKNVGIRKLVLHIISSDSKVVSSIDRWLHIAVKENIQELDLSVNMKGNCYTLPQTIFSAKSLTWLRLCGCKFETGDSIVLPNLQKLYLRKVKLNDCILQNLISGCPFIEDLRLVQCQGLKDLLLLDLDKLNRVEIHYCSGLGKIQVYSANLHTFWFCARRRAPCSVILAGCKSLKRLTLQHSGVALDFCKNWLSTFPLLEKLDLTIEKERSIKICSPRLQRFVLKGCKTLGFVFVEAPNLQSFEYKGHKMPYIDFKPFCLRDAKLSLEVTCKAVPDSGDRLFYSYIRDFIKQFDSEGLKLVVRSKKNIVIHENLDDVCLPNLPSLNIDIIKSSVSSEDVLDSLLRTWHPENLCIISSFFSKFPKLVYEKLKNKEKDPSCCKYIALSNKCWRHFLKDVKFEDFGDALDNWLMSSPTGLSCHLTNTSLRLYWNTSLYGEK